jgi:hypothetical protein
VLGSPLLIELLYSMLQVLYPGFLWGLIAVALPIFIHLLQLRRPQRVLFTNTGFIREVELTTNRQRRLQELLVLLVRVLAIVALVGIFCQPYLPAKKHAVDGDTSVAVLIDDSPSMQAPSTTQANVLEEALNGARALGRSYGASGRFQLVNQLTGPIGSVAYDAKLAGIQAAKGKANWQEIGTRYLAKASPQQPLYLFSDFQKSAQTENFFRTIPTGKEIVLVPQVARQSGNVYVDSVWLEDAFIRKGLNLGLHIRLRNGGSKQLLDCPVKVLLEERQVAAFRTTVDAGQATTVVVQVQLTDAKLALGRVVTEDAPITFDNSYYFTLQPAAVIRVLEIGDAPVAQRAYASEPLFAYSFTKPQEVNYEKLRQANIVLVNEVPLLNAGLREALVQVVRQGGSIVVIPTSKITSQESYHQLFRALGTGNEQWNATAAGALVRQEVAIPNHKSPFFKDVLGAQPRQVAMPQAAAVLRWGRSGTDILRLRDGDSYLTEFSSGTGRFYVFAAPFDKAYSDFASHALFVPVLYRLAMLSYHSDQHLAYSLTEPMVTLTVPQRSSEKPAAGADASLRLVRDSAVFVPTQRIQGTEAHLDVPSGLREPGFYEVRQQGKLLTTLAFNANQHESELAAYSTAELRALIGPNRPNVHVLDDGAQPTAITRYRAEQTGQPLWRYCLALALVCLLVEGLLLRFGRPKVAAAARPLVAV